MRKKILLGAGIVAGALTALPVWNDHRAAFKPQSLDSAAYGVDVQKLSVRTGGHTLYGELLLPRGKSGPLPTNIPSTAWSPPVH